MIMNYDYIAGSGMGKVMINLKTVACKTTFVYAIACYLDWVWFLMKGVHS